MTGDERNPSVWRVVEAAAALLVLGFFLWGLRDLLNPFVLFVLLWALLLPFRDRPGHSALVATLAALTLFWLLRTTGSLLAPFILAIVLAYILDPLVDALERRRLPRTGAIVILTLPVVGVVAGLLFVAIPAALSQLGEVAERAPILFERAAGLIEGVSQRLERVDVPFLDEEALAQRLRGIDSAAVVAFLEERRSAVGDWVWTGLLGLGRGLGSVLGVLSYVVLTPVLTFYLLRDWDALTRALGDLIPRGRRAGVVSFTSEYDHLLGRYLRGQVTVALAVGFITGLGLWIASFPYAATLGLIVAIFSVVPYLGLVLSLVPALFIALVSGAVGPSLLKVAIVYGLAQVLEGTFISPRIVGDSVGLHPVLIVLALAVGGFFFGFVGLLIGVPLAVGVKLLAERGLAEYRASGLYLGRGPGATP